MIVTAGSLYSPNVTLTFRQLAGSKTFSFTGTVAATQMVGWLNGHVFNNTPITLNVRS